MKGASILAAAALGLGLGICPSVEPLVGGDKTSATRLAVRDARFTVNDQPRFLFGISYYGALGASDETMRRDLADLKKHGFNWVRVWATWAAFGHDVSAVDADGMPREPSMKKLQAFVAMCDRNGIVVDVTLSRGNGATGPARLQTLDAHRRAVDALVSALRPQRNWYLDLANERNIKDKRFASIADLKELRARVRALDPSRLVTASHAGDIAQKELRDYLLTIALDFVSPHRPRTADSANETEAKSRAYGAWMREIGRVVPLHYQEPFRRDFGHWQARAEDYVADLKAAIAGGAAGWCWHNGANAAAKDGRPRRSFDLRDQRLFEQFDDEESKALPLLAKIVAQTPPAAQLK